MTAFEILVAWFLLSLTGALAPGPLSAAVVMQASRRGRLHGMLPMVGHAIVEVGIIAAIILGVQAISLHSSAISLMVGFGGIVIVGFGALALRDYKVSSRTEIPVDDNSTTSSTMLEATAQGALVSVLSPYFLLWWFGVGLSTVTLLVVDLEVGVGTVFVAGLLIYLTHISTDLIFGAFLAMGTEGATKRASVGDINWISVIIGLFQIALGVWFIWQALF